MDGLSKLFRKDASSGEADGTQGVAEHHEVLTEEEVKVDGFVRLVAEALNKVYEGRCSRQIISLAAEVGCGCQ